MAMSWNQGDIKLLLAIGVLALSVALSMLACAAAAWLLTDSGWSRLVLAVGLALAAFYLTLRVVALLG